MAAPVDAPPPPGYRYIGKLGRSFGLAGGLRFHAAGPRDAGVVVHVDRVFVEGLGDSPVREVRAHAGDVIVYLARARNRDQARALANAAVYVDPALVPGDDEDTFYLENLIGAPVVSLGADRSAEAAAHDAVPDAVGEVVDVITGAGQDLLVVATPSGRLLLPWQAPYVRFDGERVQLVDPPEGLLEG